MSTNRVKKIANLIKLHNEWILKGMPVRKEERIAEIYDNICSKCEHFKNDKCKICGCNIKRSGIYLNKLAMAVSKCPDNPPKWEEEKTEENIDRIPRSRLIIPKRKENVEKT